MSEKKKKTQKKVRYPENKELGDNTEHTIADINRLASNFLDIESESGDAFYAHLRGVMAGERNFRSEDERWAVNLAIDVLDNPIDHLENMMFFYGQKRSLRYVSSVLMGKRRINKSSARRMMRKFLNRLP